MKRVFKEVGWRSRLEIDFLLEVVHAGKHKVIGATQGITLPLFNLFL
jgi:hypothetical protein